MTAKSEGPAFTKDMAMSQVGYTNHPPNGRPPGSSGATGDPYPTFCAHDVAFAQARAISPETIRMQGDRSINPLEARRLGFPELAGCLISLTNIYGLVYGYILRPHNPPEGTGKYLFVAGFRPDMHVPLSHTQHVQNIDVPAVWMESPVKANAGASAKIDTPILPIGGGGVYGFRGSTGIHSSVIDGIPACHKKRGKVERRRKEYIGFDSDTATNDKVARARQRLTGIRQGQGADVWWIDLPAAPDGGKQGFDDVLGSGVSMSEILSWAYAAPDCSMIPHAEKADTDELATVLAENRRLKQELAQAEAAKDAALDLAENTALKPTEKIVLVRTLRLADQARRHNKLDAHGNARLTPAQIANDFRKKDAEGQFNDDGTRIALPRRHVLKTLHHLRLCGPLHFAEEQPAKKPDNPLHKYANDVLIEPVENMADMLRRYARYQPTGADGEAGRVVNRAKRGTKVCTNCGEAHAIKRTDRCAGCNAIIDEKIIEREPEAPDVEEAPAAAAEADPVGDKVFTTETVTKVGDKVFTTAPEPDPSPPPRSTDPRLPDIDGTPIARGRYRLASHDISTQQGAD